MQPSRRETLGDRKRVVDDVTRRDVMPVVITPGINHDGQSDVGCRTVGRRRPRWTVGGVFDLASVAGWSGQPRVRVCSCRCRIGGIRPDLADGVRRCRRCCVGRPPAR